MHPHYIVYQPAVTNLLLIIQINLAVLVSLQSWGWCEGAVLNLSKTLELTTVDISSITVIQLQEGTWSSVGKGHVCLQMLKLKKGELKGTDCTPLAVLILRSHWAILTDMPAKSPAVWEHRTSWNTLKTLPYLWKGIWMFCSHPLKTWNYIYLIIINNKKEKLHA